MRDSRRAVYSPPRAITRSRLRNNSYQSDFALLYLRRSLALAEETGDNDLIMRARSGIALCYSLGGRFYEAEEILSGIRDTVRVSRRTLQSYYVARHRMNRELYALTA